MATAGTRTAETRGAAVIARRRMDRARVREANIVGGLLGGWVERRRGGGGRGGGDDDDDGGGFDRVGR